jgi:hypothetical protein
MSRADRVEAKEKAFASGKTSILIFCLDWNPYFSAMIW